jgi:hydroxypyruvate isomerase
MIRWSVSLTLLFKEVPFLDRFQAAAEAGFGAVEFQWPTSVNLDALVTAKEAAGLEVAAFNVDAGDISAGERGFSNDPARRDWWRERVLLAFDLAQRLRCRRLTILAGNAVPGLSRSAMLDCLTDNLAWAVAQVGALGIALLLEPLNPIENPHYLLSRIADALDVMERLSDPYLQLQLDMYHTHRTEANLTEVLQRYITHIGHIQIADSPVRNEPGSGAIDWRFVLGQLEALNYQEYVGLEYNPRSSTLQSLDWLPPDKRRQSTVRDFLP